MSRKSRLKQQNPEITKTESVLRRICDLPEYILMLTVMLDGQSYYVHATTNAGVNMTKMFGTITIVLLAAVCLLHILFAAMHGKLTKKTAADWFLIPVVLFGYLLLMYALNVLRLYPKGATKFIRYFLIALPLFTLLFRMKRAEGKTFDLILKYSDIICVFAVLNLAAYFAGIAHLDSIHSDVAYTAWSGDQRSYLLHTNFVNLCMEVPGLRWQILGIKWLRNYGLFIEPLLYTAALMTSLFAELFLRPRTDRTRIWRWILLTFTEITTQAILGLVILAGGWALKGIQVLVGKNKKKLVIPVVALMLAAGIFVVAQKQSHYYETTDTSRTSTMDHLDDYRIGFEAFLKHPLLGGGYGNSKYLRSFMTEGRYAVNRGFSNAVSVVMGQGGLLLGGFCLFGYLIPLLHFFSRSRKNRRAALYGAGPLALFLVTVVHYRFYFSVMIALGYSLPEFEEGSNGRRKLRLICRETIPGLEEGSAEAEKEPVTDRKHTVAALAVAAAVFLMALFGTPFWNWLYVTLKTSHLMVGRNPLGSYCLWVVILFNSWLFSLCLKKEVPPVWIIFTALYDLLCACLYTRVYAWTETVLTIHGGAYAHNGALFVLLIYAAGWIGFGVLGLWIRHFRRLSWRRRWAGVLFAACACFAVFYLGYKTKGVLKRGEEEVSSDLDAVQKVTSAASGRVYSNELSLLYHHLNHGIAFSAANDGDFAACADASVIFQKDTVVRELFNAGYEVTALTDNLVLYTCDAAVIDELGSEGYSFYRYYPYPVKKKSKRDFLSAGKYTVNFSLHADPETLSGVSGDTVLGEVQVYTDYGDRVIAQKEMTAGEFDADGNAEAELVFSLGADTERIVYRVVSSENYEISRESVFLKETPDYITLRTYNGNRDVVREEYYNEDGSEYMQTAGYSMVERTYDNADLVQSLRYFLNGVPTLISSGYAEVKYTYNRKERVSGESYYGTDGEPVALRTGQAAVEYGYDDYGNRSVERYYGTDGNPVTLTTGYAEVRRTYDEKNRMVREEYYDADGQRVLRTEGYSAYERELDDDGHVLVQRYFDTEDRPVLNTYGYAVIRWTYDEDGRLLTESYFDTSDAPVLISAGYASLKRSYDSYGRIAREEYFGTDGNPVMRDPGYAAEEREYDSAGNVTVSRYYDTSGQPCLITYGYAEIHREYNEKRQKIREFYFGTDGMPIACTGGYYGFEFAYDDVGNLSALTYLDAAGQPMTAPNGVTVIRYEYDAKKNRTADYYYDADGNAVNATNGVSEVHRTYDEANNVISTVYYNTAGETVELSG